jgi:hypothetical protein
VAPDKSVAKALVSLRETAFTTAFCGIGSSIAGPIEMCTASNATVKSVRREKKVKKF